MTQPINWKLFGFKAQNGIFFSFVETLRNFLQEIISILRPKQTNQRTNEQKNNLANVKITEWRKKCPRERRRVSLVAKFCQTCFSREDFLHLLFPEKQKKDLGLLWLSACRTNLPQHRNLWRYVAVVVVDVVDVVAVDVTMTMLTTFSPCNFTSIN